MGTEEDIEAMKKADAGLTKAKVKKVTVMCQICKEDWNVDTKLTVPFSEDPVISYECHLCEAVYKIENPYLKC